MIRSFTSKGLKRFAATGDASKLSVNTPADIARVGRVVAALDAATVPEDLNIPGFGFHQLTGDRKGTYAVKASANYRVTWEWEHPDAINVNLEDYH